MYYNIKIKSNGSEFCLESKNKDITQREMDIYFARIFNASEEFCSKIKQIEINNDKLISINQIEQNPSEIKSDIQVSGAEIVNKESFEPIQIEQPQEENTLDNIEENIEEFLPTIEQEDNENSYVIENQPIEIEPEIITPEVSKAPLTPTETIVITSSKDVSPFLPLEEVKEVVEQKPLEEVKEVNEVIETPQKRVEVKTTPSFKASDFDDEEDTDLAMRRRNKHLRELSIKNLLPKGFNFKKEVKKEVKEEIKEDIKEEKLDSNWKLDETIYNELYEMSQDEPLEEEKEELKQEPEKVVEEKLDEHVEQKPLEIEEIKNVEPQKVEEIKKETEIQNEGFHFIDLEEKFNNEQKDVQPQKPEEVVEKETIEEKSDNVSQNLNAIFGDEIILSNSNKEEFSQNDLPEEIQIVEEETPIPTEIKNVDEILDNVKKEIDSVDISELSNLNNFDEIFSNNQKQTIESPELTLENGVIQNDVIDVGLKEKTIQQEKENYQKEKLEIENKNQESVDGIFLNEENKSSDELPKKEEPSAPLDFKVFLSGFNCDDLKKQFLIGAYYIKHFAKLDGFSMKLINSKLFQAVGKIADLSILDDLIEKNYVKMIETQDGKKYSITQDGEEYFARTFQG